MAKKNSNQGKSKKNKWVGVLVGAVALMAIGSQGEETPVETSDFSETPTSVCSQETDTTTHQFETESSSEIETEPSLENETESSSEIETEEEPTEPETSNWTETTAESYAQPTTQSPTEAQTEPPATIENSSSAETEERIVYITDNGNKYHRGSCRYVKDSKIEISLDDAIKNGYEPCKVCKPN